MKRHHPLRGIDRDVEGFATRIEDFDILRADDGSNIGGIGYACHISETEYLADTIVGLEPSLTMSRILRVGILVGVGASDDIQDVIHAESGVSLEPGGDNSGEIGCRHRRTGIVAIIIRLAGDVEFAGDIGKSLRIIFDEIAAACRDDAGTGSHGVGEHTTIDQSCITRPVVDLEGVKVECVLATGDIGGGFAVIVHTDTDYIFAGGYIADREGRIGREFLRPGHESGAGSVAGDIGMGAILADEL